MPDPRALAPIDSDVSHIADGDQVPPGLEPISQTELPAGTIIEGSRS